MSHLEMLGYHDSGMEGWPQNESPGSFWQTPIEAPARRLAELMGRYEPQVVVTYDENGFYGHPDHIQSNRVTLAALTQSGVPVKLYYTAVARSMLRGFRDVLAEAGIEGPADLEGNPDFGTPDELITTTIDCTAVAGRKYASLAAHASQSDNIFFLQMGEEMFSTIMGSESFVRAVDSTNAPCSRGRLVRRTALSREARARVPTGEEGRRPRPERPYVAVLAGVEPERTRAPIR